MDLTLDEYLELSAWMMLASAIYFIFARLSLQIKRSQRGRKQLYALITAAPAVAGLLGVMTFAMLYSLLEFEPSMLVAMFAPVVLSIYLSRTSYDAAIMLYRWAKQGLHRLRARSQTA